MGRPLLQWGAVYFAAGSLICAGGFAARHRPVALGFLGGGAAVHAALLVLDETGIPAILYWDEHSRTVLVG
ncbi:MAG: hypothetical protein ACPLQO_01070 [Desulfotomaculales bacterium]